VRRVIVGSGNLERAVHLAAFRGRRDSVTALGLDRPELFG